jgi:hypothetical protein
MFFKKISSKFHFIATGKIIPVKIKDDKPKVSFLSKIKISQKAKINIYMVLGFIFVVSVSTIITQSVFQIKHERKKVSKEDPIKTMLETAFRKEREKAFFWGQKNAIEGDIRIKKINDSTWIWAKSPWDDGTLATVTVLHVDKGQRK